MVRLMNKKEFIKVLEEKTGFSEDKCIIINDIFEDTFLVGKKNKEKIIAALVERLQIDEEKANDIYNIGMGIIGSEIINKLKEPFKDKD